MSGTVIRDVTATQTPAITIAKTTTTPTYSAVGNVLSYSLLVTNTGNVPLTSLAVSDPNAVLGACASVAIGGTLNPGQTTTCSATHPVVQADLNAGSYTNTATQPARSTTHPSLGTVIRDVDRDADARDHHRQDHDDADLQCGRQRAELFAARHQHRQRAADQPCRQ